MKVPAFLLRRLYVKGSLRNTPDGFAFELKNSLGSGYAEQALPLRVDEREVRLDRSRFVVDGTATPFTEVSAERPMTLGMNRKVAVEVNGDPLPPGKHRIEIGFVVSGMGEMRFDVTDAIEATESAAAS